MSEIKNKYWIALAGFEKYAFTDEQIRLAEGSLGSAIEDIAACENCDGETCMTSINHRCRNRYLHFITRTGKCDENCYPEQFRGYYGLHHAGCRLYSGPSFAVHRCPGPEERKQQIITSRTPAPEVMAGARQWEGN